MTWLSAAPVALLAAVWLLVPGLPATYALGLRGVTAWAVAPVVSIGSAAVAAVVAGFVGVPWSPIVAVVPAVVLAVLFAAGRWVLHRYRPPVSRPEPDGWRCAAGATVGVAGALVLGWLTAQRGFGRPDALSQTYDAVFHYNTVTRILESGNASSLGAGSLNVPSSATAFYPAAWHDVVSLVVLSGGAPLTVSTNMVAVVVAAVVWPLTCLVLVRQLTGRSTVAAVITPLVSVGFIAFPWSLLSFGVLWPNLIGLALVPVGVAAVVAACGLSDNATLTRPQAVAVGGITVIALGLSHPNAVFTLVALGIVPAAWAFVGWLQTRVRTGAWVSSAAVLVVVLVVAAAAADFLATSPLFASVRSFDWPAFESPSQAVGEVLLNATDSKDAAWSISFVVVLGVIAAVRSRHTRWLIPAHLISAGLYMFAASLETPLSALLTGFWYNDPYRLAAMVPLTGVPFAVLGLLSAGRWIAEHLPQRARDGAEPSRWRDVAAVAAVAAATLVLIVASRGLYVRDHADFIASTYSPPSDANLVNSDEQAFFARIAPLIPTDAVVAQNPWSGSALLWALDGRRVLFPVMSGQWTPDQLYLAQHLRDADRDSRACAAANRLGVDYLLVGRTDFWPTDARPAQYPGLASPEPRSGFDLVASDNDGNQLFRLTACSAGTPQ